MTDTADHVDPIPTPPALVVNPNPLPAQAATLGRDLLLVLSFLPALMAVLGRRDLLALISLFQTEQGLQVLAIIILPLVLLWRQMLSRWTTRQKVTLARSASDEVAVVKGEDSKAV